MQSGRRSADDAAISTGHQMTRRRLGRKPFPSEVARSERVVTFVTRKEKQQLEDLANAASQSVSAVCHRLLAQGLRDEAKTSEKRKNHGECS